jgi:hypothetical protein
LLRVLGAPGRLAKGRFQPDADTLSTLSQTAFDREMADAEE